MKTYIVICLIAKTFLVQALSDVSLQGSEIKKLGNWNIDDIDFSLEETSPDSQRKRDRGYYYNKPSQISSNNYLLHSRHGYKGKVVTKLQNQVNRPFNQYGPPNHENSLHNRNRPINSFLNQDVPIPIRQTEFIEESPIASQNNLPFGQHTANYLPPRNQKLPSHIAPDLFLNKDNLPRQHFQQQPPPVQLQQQKFNQVQHQNVNQVQQQEIQPQTNDQNSFGQDFSTPNFNEQQNDINKHQISDAALFLSQNAPAISQLYETPALNQNYAPYNQESQQENQHQIQNQNLQILTPNELPQFSSQQFPSYSSGIINAQQTLEHVKSLEKDKLISQLRLELSNRENAARFAENNEDVRNTQNADSISFISQFPPRNGQVATSFNQRGSFSSPSLPVVSSSYQEFYPPPVAAPPAQLPIVTTTSPPVSTTFQSSHFTSESGSGQIGLSLPGSENVKPSATSTYPQYGGFVPTFISPANSDQSIPPYDTTLFHSTAIKSAENSPTHFGIPIPTFQDERPVHVLPNPPTTSKPTSISLHSGISTVVLPLSSIRHFPSHPQIGKPSPVSIIPAAASIHPTYGVRPAVINPSFIYKPVKIYPVYQYPHLGYSLPVRKSVYSTALTHPWSYAPSYAQTKPIWK